MDTEDFTDKELLDACIQGDEKSWDVFVNKNTNLIYHTIRQVLNTYGIELRTQQKNDIHNNLLLFLIKDDYKKLRQYDGRNSCSVSSWLSVVTSNFVLNVVKKQKSQVPLNSTTDSVHEIEDLTECREPRPDEGLLIKEYNELINELVSELNANDMLFVELFYRKGLAPESIAEILSTSVNNVYSKKARIKKKLIKIAKKKNFLQDF
ncbi:MAG: sigma-70 family RNA polymerase sigma factor [Candidatus Scalindua rubra]|uniref:RNA polymerase sigma factor n=1 Tax=Candidatus Scalindua brodae TaxID=237368 RepID=A0A0B0EBC9_9BACT|nr:MAG: RNA polymerase sigma factor [Candidatus Scalindua brodae]MBZ0108772.1 sigma-70 family RNA polymerase sigma factor [Candidatus Scalindua rubra]TWU30623.1 RNA polymerase sigma factor [Candidatus Brocadiaceae bacterium S225]